MQKFLNYWKPLPSCLLCRRNEAFTTAPVAPKRAGFPFVFLPERQSVYVQEASGPREPKSTNKRELLSVESFGYICEDQTTGPLCGPLGGCERLQRRRTAGQRADKTVSVTEITCGIQLQILRSFDNCKVLCCVKITRFILWLKTKTDQGPRV